jgi:hypothetical protein
VFGISEINFPLENMGNPHDAEAASDFGHSATNKLHVSREKKKQLNSLKGKVRYEATVMMYSQQLK